MQELLKLGAQSRERASAVAMLTALSSCGNDDSTGLVGQPNARLSSVLVLPSLASGSEGVNSALREEVVV